MAFECFSSTFQGKFHFQGLFKTVLHIQVLFKPVGILGEENGILLSSGVKGLAILPNKHIQEINSVLRYWNYSKTCVKRLLALKKTNWFSRPCNYRLMPLEHSAILSTFIKLPFVIKIFVLSILAWPFYTGFIVHVMVI